MTPAFNGVQGVKEQSIAKTRPKVHLVICIELISFKRVFPRFFWRIGSRSVYPAGKVNEIGKACTIHTS
jgi:hypothetical protein